MIQNIVLTGTAVVYNLGDLKPIAEYLLGKELEYDDDFHGVEYTTMQEYCTANGFDVPVVIQEQAITDTNVTVLEDLVEAMGDTLTIMDTLIDNIDLRTYIELTDSQTLVFNDNTEYTYKYKGGEVGDIWTLPISPQINRKHCIINDAPHDLVITDLITLKPTENVTIAFNSVGYDIISKDVKDFNVEDSLNFSNTNVTTLVDNDDFLIKDSTDSFWKRIKLSVVKSLLGWGLNVNDLWNTNSGNVLIGANSSYNQSIAKLNVFSETNQYGVALRSKSINANDIIGIVLTNLQNIRSTIFLRQNNFVSVNRAKNSQLVISNEGSICVNPKGGTFDVVIGSDPTLSSSFLAFQIKTNGGISIPATVTPVGMTGDRTISRVVGKINAAPGTTSLVVTNSLVTATSVVLCSLGTNDATCEIKAVVESSGSFAIYYTAPTVETVIKFFIIN